MTNIHFGYIPKYTQRASSALNVPEGPSVNRSAFILLALSGLCFYISPKISINLTCGWPLCNGLSVAEKSTTNLSNQNLLLAAPGWLILEQQYCANANQVCTQNMLFT